MKDLNIKMHCNKNKIRGREFVALVVQSICPEGIGSEEKVVIKEKRPYAHFHWVVLYLKSVDWYSLLVAVSFS